MKNIRRSKRFHLSHEQCRPTKSPLTTTDDEDDDDEFEHFRTNRNANRAATILSLDQQHLQSSSDHSSLFLHSIHSQQKALTQSDDLTPLSLTISNTTPLTPLTCSNTKQTELATVKIDLTDLSVTDTFDSSFNRKFSIFNIENSQKKSAILYDTDASTTSKIFSSENLSTANIELNSTEDTRVNLLKRLPSNWNLHPMTNKLKLVLSCLSLVVIAGVVLLAITL